MSVNYKILLIRDHFLSGVKLHITRFMGIIFVNLSLISFAGVTSVESQFTDNRISAGKVIYVSKLDQYKSDIPYTIQGRVCAYTQYQQALPEGMERIGNWPVEVFNSIGRFRIRDMNK